MQARAFPSLDFPDWWKNRRATMPWQKLSDRGAIYSSLYSETFYNARPTPLRQRSSLAAARRRDEIEQVIARIAKGIRADVWADLFLRG
jgi:hypothetical protein